MALNTISAFFLLNSKGKECIDTLLADIPDIEQYAIPTVLKQAIAAQLIYETEIQRAFGLNFFLTYIPFTDAFEAKINYLRALENLYPSLEKYNSQHSLMDWFTHALTSTPFFFLKDFFSHFNTVATDPKNHLDNVHKNSATEVFKHFPLWSDFVDVKNNELELHSEWYWKVLHTLRNPLRLVEQLFDFLHWSWNSLAEVGLDKNSEPSILSLILKYTGLVIFLPLKFVVAIASALIDSAWKLIYHFTVKPLIFIVNAFEQFIEYYNKTFILADIKSLQGAKVLRKLEEQPELLNQSFRSITSSLSDAESKTNVYLVQPKADVYQRLTNTNELTLIATSSEKAEALITRMNRFNKFRSEHPEFTDRDCMNSFEFGA